MTYNTFWWPHLDKQGPNFNVSLLSSKAKKSHQNVFQTGQESKSGIKMSNGIVITNCFFKSSFVAHACAASSCLFRSISRNWREWPKLGKSSSPTSSLSPTSPSCPMWPGVWPLSPRPEIYSPPTERSLDQKRHPPEPPPRANPATCLIPRTIPAASPVGLRMWSNLPRQPLQTGARPRRWKHRLVKSNCSAEENWDSAALDFPSARSIDKDSAPPA